MESLFEQLGGTYTRQGDYCLPDVCLFQKKKREDLLDKIKQIRAFIVAAPQDENTGNLLSYLSDLEKDVNGKKYGLVFEEHREEIDEVLDTHTPVLTEEADLFIDHGGQMNFLLEGDNGKHTTHLPQSLLKHLLAPCLLREGRLQAAQQAELRFCHTVVFHAVLTVFLKIHVAVQLIDGFIIQSQRLLQSLLTVTVSTLRDALIVIQILQEFTGSAQRIWPLRLLQAGRSDMKLCCIFQG